jgi:hypothetical protein
MPPRPPWVLCYSNESRTPGSPLLLQNFNPAQRKYSAYDHKLLAFYEAIKHFRHKLEARHFIIFTDHKPITYTFQQERDKCSPWPFKHLDIVAQFTTDIQHISGQDLTDVLSRFKAITAPPSYEALAASQGSDDELL